MAPKRAVMGNPARADHALAHSLSIQLKQEIRKEQNAQGTDRVDLGPFALGAFCCWNGLMRIPVLRIQLGFPKTCSFMSSMQEQTMQIIGYCCLADDAGLRSIISVDERAAAAEAREEIMAELAQLPVWVETRLELMSVELQHVLCRYLNALIETVFELQDTLSDPVLAQLSNKCAETCLRCRFQRSPNSGVIASDTPRSITSTSTWHGSRSQAYGLGPRNDPNLALSAHLVHPPVTTPPSTHLGGGTMGAYAAMATGSALEDEEEEESWDMGD